MLIFETICDLIYGKSLIIAKNKYKKYIFDALTKWRRVNIIKMWKPRRLPQIR